MPFGKTPPRRTLRGFPDKQELAGPLDVPDVHTVHLRLTLDGAKTTARWRIPWFAVVFTVLIATGSVTGGIYYGYTVDRISGTVAGILLGLIWLVMVPAGGWIGYRAFRRALRKPQHLVLDPEQQVFTVACLDEADEAIPFAQAKALVQVSRWVATGHSGRQMARVDEFSFVFEASDGSHQQLPLYSIQDSGKRMEQLRRWTDALPRVIGCERVRVAFDRKGQLQD